MYLHPNFKRCQETGKPIIEISHSGLNTFNSCPKKFAWRKMIVQAGRDREESDASAVGSALHDGLQNYARTRSMHEALVALALRHPVELQDPAKASVYSLAASVITMRHVLAEGVLDNFELATFKVDGKSHPAVEVPALVVIETPHFVFHLRQFIDLVLYNPVSERFFALDIKTTTETGLRNFDEKYRWDWQVTSYGIPLAGLLGAEGNFEVGILGVVQHDRDPKYVMPTWTRTKHDVDAYYHWLLEAVIRIQRMALGGIFTRQPTACVGYGKVCPYFAACGVDNLREMQMLVNPSGALGDEPRPFVPFYTAKLEIE